VEVTLAQITALSVVVLTAVATGQCKDAPEDFAARGCAARRS
jgi:hypothetical protein